MKKNLIRQYLFNYRLNHCNVYFLSESWYEKRIDDPYWKAELITLRHLKVLRNIDLIKLNVGKTSQGNKIYIPKIISHAKERFLKSYYSIPRNVYTKSDWQ